MNFRSQWFGKKDIFFVGGILITSTEVLGPDYMNQVEALRQKFAHALYVAYMKVYLITSGVFDFGFGTVYGGFRAILFCHAPKSFRYAFLYFHSE